MHEHESREDYLERILILKEKLKNVRSVDLANYMNFSKASVSIAMKKLKDDNKITVDSNGYINLTKDGLLIAKQIYERHIILKKGLMLLGVEEETAAKDACLIEHDLSDQTFEKIKTLVEANSKTNL